MRAVNICTRSYIEPTILLNPPLESEIMREEIFGPLLPIITVSPGYPLSSSVH